MDNNIAQLIIESYTEPIRQVAIEYNILCTDFVENVTNALEIYECACLLERFEVVSEGGLVVTNSHNSSSNTSGDENKEQSSNNNSTPLNKEHRKKFFDKIIEFVKKMIDKLKKIAGIIFDKVKKFLNILKSLNNAAGHVLVGKKPKVFKNGFTIDIQKGAERFTDFVKGYDDLSDYIEDFFHEFMKVYRDDDMFRGFAKRRQKDIIELGSGTTRGKINEFMNSDIDIGDDITEWVEKIFEYKFMGENFIPSPQQCSDMANSIVKAQNTDIQQWQRSLLNGGISTFETLRNDLTRLKDAETDTTRTSTLGKLVNIIANYSNIGVSILSTFLDFYIQKSNTLVNYLVSTGYLVLKK